MSINIPKKPTFFKITSPYLVDDKISIHISMVIFLESHKKTKFLLLKTSFTPK